MKNILILTDFSEKAKNAALYGLRMAEKTRRDIILFNCFGDYEPVNTEGSGPWGDEDDELVKKESITELKKLKYHMGIHYDQSAYTPAISVLNDLGPDLATCAEEIVKKKQVDLIVMGTRGEDTLSHFLNGSDTYDILEKVDCPVLFVPEDSGLNRLDTIIFANDFKRDYSREIAMLTDIARTNDSHIIMAHFGEYENAAFDYLDKIKNKMGFVNVSSRLFPLENVDEQLSDFAETAGAGLIVMIHHRGIGWKKLVGGSRSRNILKHNHTPLLIFPG